ncbi:GDP-L-fucose synthase family protein [Algimonas porphyrae]|uniref:GDP-L-fucose synthase n=1 Tax=Algimonas porphyrae TaxID=1128113 RepID=A0ABQ5V4M6_9PROT|nr:GDP-L-fucose synthase [Algimonas porphyrae]GLQ21232.1 GDP-L-fucose synthase [Algimonas porphyrae]
MPDPATPEPLFDLSGQRIWVSGHRGMVGSALLRRLEREDVADVLTAGRETLDLTDQHAVQDWVAGQSPDVAIIAAAKVGGIVANRDAPADFLYENLMIASHAIHAAYRAGVKKLLFLGSSCIYPKFAEQPIREDSLMTGPLEPTNEWYAIAKIAGVKLCQAYRAQHGCDFISAMPTNLYGPGDNYDLTTSHVIPALIRKAEAARLNGAETMEIWGTGSARREFMHVDDLADAAIHVLTHYSNAAPINIGSGSDVTILELTRAVMAAVGFEGVITHDRSKPDGTPRKLMDGSKLNALGWAPSISLEAGLSRTVETFREEHGGTIANP